jgi:hypothetical protein
MVGDGINDAPALAAGFTSMAPSTASDIGRTAAETVWMGESASAVATAIEVSRRSQRIAKENFALAVAYNVLAVPLAFGIALFLTETCPVWLRRPLGTAIELLAAVPSIIYGMFGLFVFAPLFADYFQVPVKEVMGGMPLIGWLFGGAPNGLGILAAGVILAVVAREPHLAGSRGFPGGAGEEADGDAAAAQGAEQGYQAVGFEAGRGAEAADCGSVVEVFLGLLDDGGHAGPFGASGCDVELAARDQDSADLGFDGFDYALVLEDVPGGV